MGNQAARIGKKIRSARQNAGLSQNALARRINRSQSHIARWEAGKFVPELHSLQTLADATGTTVQALISEEES